METRKPWWRSKTLWANAIAVLAMFVQKQTGMDIDPEAQLGLLAIVNMVLRTVTKEPLGVSAAAAAVEKP